MIRLFLKLYGVLIATLAASFIVQMHLSLADAQRVPTRGKGEATSSELPGETMEVLISSVAPIATVRSAVKGFDVQGVIAKPSPRLRPGMTLDVILPAK